MNTLREMKGVGPKREKLLNRLGIFSPKDLIYYFPRSYEDRSVFSRIADAVPGESVSISMTVAREFVHSRIRGGRILSRGVAFDDTGRISITFFNQRWAAEKLKAGEQYIFYGKIGGDLFKKEIINPSIEKLSDYDPSSRILPVYSLCEGLTQKYLRSLIAQALEEYARSIADPLCSVITDDMDMCALSDSIRDIHFPKDHEAQARARRRLVFDELFYMSLGISLLKSRSREISAVSIDRNIDMKPFYDSLPFELTGAQKRAIADCERDFERSIPMNRLVQGDVGCGKTSVAAAVIYRCVKSNHQAAFMAPTEVLARQQYETLSKLLGPLGIEVELLCGSMSRTQRDEARRRIAAGHADVVVGTHALISEGVEFYDLGLTVTDEQHRFGVRQRANLIGKGDGVHTLVMSATPIPRTLGLIVYGDLDISTIEELPAGRKKILTYLIGSDKRTRAYNFVKKQADMGFSSYIICPAVEDSQEYELTSVESLFEELHRGVLSDLSLAMLHGRMKADEKRDVMERFSSGEVQALISTTVVEVGVDVKNATLMIIENADRFGLSQLHQLRGRVGRSDNQSYCVLICDSKNEATLKRLKTLVKTNDGFEIAQVDLELRGPGDFLGNRQHGLPYLKLASLMDMEMITLARAAAERLIERDPYISSQKNALILEKVNELFFDDEKRNTFN